MFVNNSKCVFSSREYFLTVKEYNIINYISIDKKRYKAILGYGFVAWEFGNKNFLSDDRKGQ